MGMIQIDMLMPEGCSECRFETKRGFCKAMPDNFCGCTNDEGRPEWCPLEEQEPILVDTKMIGMTNGADIEVYCCRDCREVLDPVFNYCPNCGKEMKWE